MSLTIGTTLGPYAVTAKIGEGGMGEVYRARDTKLDRDVALKVLPQAFTEDPDRLARFEREAKVLASLNHPNIGHIYGLEEAEGQKALVLELIEGPTLADRIKQGPIPVDEALPIAKQIADAWEAAHEQGVIHLDLKPPNLKVRPDGTEKVLDFSLVATSDAHVVEQVFHHFGRSAWPCWGSHHPTGWSQSAGSCCHCLRFLNPDRSMKAGAASEDRR